jgi:hypothetical protein
VDECEPLDGGEGRAVDGDGWTEESGLGRNGVGLNWIKEEGVGVSWSEDDEDDGRGRPGRDSAAR